MVEKPVPRHRDIMGAIAECREWRRNASAMFSRHAACHDGVPDTQYGSPGCRNREQSAGIVVRARCGAMDEQGYTWRSRLQRRRTVTVASEVGCPDRVAYLLSTRQAHQPLGASRMQ